MAGGVFTLLYPHELYSDVFLESLKSVLLLQGSSKLTALTEISDRK